MRRLKEQKGITLVALIITIIVLLILAVVAIGAITQDGIINHAKNARQEYGAAQVNESTIIGGYLNKIENNLPGNGDETEGGEGEDDSGSGTGTYTAYEVGDTVTIGTESFYVIEASDATKETLVLLTKERIDISTYKQSASASGVTFSLTNYWESDYQAPIYDLVETGEPSSEHYAAYHAYKYAKAIDESANGRLMTHSEANTLRNTNDTLQNIIYGTESSNGYVNYWLGSAAGPARVHIVGYYNNKSFIDMDSFGGNYGVRPVVIISKSLL